MMLTPNQLNFSGGPGALPESVLQQVQQAIIAVPDVGLSILGISHRSDWFANVMHELEHNVRSLLGLPPNYHVLMLQGGATQQFSMIPMTWLRGSTEAADYLHTGYWSGKSLTEAQREGPMRVLWQGGAIGNATPLSHTPSSIPFSRLPMDDELDFNPRAPYFHYISNETVEGLQFQRVLGRDDVPRVCDMSSDFLSRPCEAERYSLIYAHAQKNLGPAGVTVVVLRDEWLLQAKQDAPGFLDYRTHIAAHSIYNTPPVFAIYVVLLVTRWLLNEVGGLANMHATNTAKAARLYQVIDESDGFYRGRAAVADRSLMNVTFNLPSVEHEQKFLAAAQQAGFSGLAGHRSVGGIRASIYNGLTQEAVDKFAEFLRDYRLAKTA